MKTLISILTAILCVLWGTHQKWHFTQFRFKQASTGHDTFSPVNDADFLIFSLSLKYAQSRFFYEGFKISAYQSFNSSVLKSRLDCIRFHGFITWDSMQPVMIHSHCACGCSAGFTRWFHHWQYRIHIDWLTRLMQSMVTSAYPEWRNNCISNVPSSLCCSQWYHTLWIILVDYINYVINCKQVMVLTLF